MTREVIERLADDELEQIITLAQDERKARTEKRRQDAIEEIRRIADSVQVQVNIGGGGRKSARTIRVPLRAGERYQSPTDPEKVYVVGKGRPPEWFEKLRARGTLPRALPETK